MTNIALPILSTGGEDPTTKVIIGVAVAAFWIVAQIYGALTKKPDKQVPPSGRRPAGTRPQPQQRPTPTARQTPPPIRANRQRPPVVRTPLQARPTPIAAPPPPVSTPPMVRRPTTQTAEPLSRQKMVGALLRPRNLKKAYVLTEVLQPPVGLRASSTGGEVVT